jgi:hypothetical protein
MSIIAIVIIIYHRYTPIDVMILSCILVVGTKVTSKYSKITEMLWEVMLI